MKKQIKKCKGLNEETCKTCKRQDKNAELLVESLVINPKTGKKVCQYYC